MAYEKHTWVCGETITADKMNHIEDGIAEGGGVEVSKIKLGTASGGGAVVPDTLLMMYAGGLHFNGSLFDIVGSKQMIGFEVEYTQTAANNAKGFSQQTSVYASWGTSSTGFTNESLLGMTDVRKQDVSTISVYALLQGMNPGSVAVDVYALCI